MSSTAARALTSVSRAAFSWKPTGRPQQTLAAAVSRSGVGLHLGACVTATLFPTQAGEGRYFLVEAGGQGEEEARVAAEVRNAEPRSQLCTTLRRGEGAHTRVQTVEHLLSAMEALGVDNCRIELSGGDEVEEMRAAGLIKGGSLENAMVCSISGGWLNPPLRFEDEPCRHKILDLIGDFSLFAQNGTQGFPIAHIIAYKAGHALHNDFLSHLSGKITVDKEQLAGQCSNVYSSYSSYVR